MSGLVKAIRNIKRSEGKILSPRVMDYLGQNTSTVLSAEHAALLAELVQDGSNDVRHSRFGASSRGDCLRKQVFAYEGMEGMRTFDPRLSNIFHDGTWRHLRWQMVGLEAGWFTHVEVPVTLPKYRLSVSIDAMNMDEGWLFELKGAFQIPLEPPMKHLLQMHTYFLATGMDTGVYLVEDKRTQEWREWVIKKDPTIMLDVKRELDALNQAVEDRRLPAPLPRGDEQCKGCPYQTWCRGQDKYPVDGTWDD